MLKNCFPHKVSKTNMSALTTSIYHCTGASNQYNKEKKEIKGNQI